MAKGFGSRSGGKERPVFTPEQMFQIELHEFTHSLLCSGRPWTPEERDRVGSLCFVYGRRFRADERPQTSLEWWRELHQMTLAMEQFNKEHRQFGTAWSQFPYTAEDVAKIIEWREQNLPANSAKIGA